MDHHRYNTRSHGWPTGVQGANERNDSCRSPRRPRRRSPCPCPPCPPCPPPRITSFFGYNINTSFLCGKFYKIARIGALLVVLVLFVWYTTGSSYNVLRKELDTLSCHISNMDNILQTATDQKSGVERKLEDIVGTLPLIKTMADKLREDIEKFKCPRNDKDNAVRNIIKEELEKYNSDKTGLTDYALESSGGEIIHTRNTKSISTAAHGLALFGIPLCESSNSPNALIQPGVMPGECWAFQGAVGSAVIKLIKPIFVTGVSVEHISRKISPTGEINTAPKDFSIWGLHRADEKEGYFFGKYTYNIDGNAVQYFPVQHRSSDTFGIVEFKIHSNHGHPEYTCVYRLRVHGELRK